MYGEQMRIQLYLLMNTLVTDSVESLARLLESLHLGIEHRVQSHEAPGWLAGDIHDFLQNREYGNI
mgnify:CR=1 FL=1